VAEGVAQGTDRGARLEVLRSGYAALEEQLAEAERGPRPRGEGAMLAPLVRSLHIALHEIEALDGQITADTSALRDRLDEATRRVELISRAPSAPTPAPTVVPSEPAERPSPLRPGTVRTAARVASVIGIVVGLFLAYEFIYTSLAHDRAQAALLTAFKQAVPTTTLDAPSSAAAEGSPVALLQIGRIGLREVVVEGTTPEDLKAGPGHLRATALPGEFGNAIIAGRRTTYGAPFGQLDQLQSGDPISVTTGQGVFTYTVSQVRQVRPGDADPLVGSLDSRLTLVTSDPAFVATGRLVVIAKLKGLPIAVPNRPPVFTSVTELGLAGDPLGYALGLVSIEILGAAVVLAWWLRRRWPLSVLLLFGVPVFAGLLLFCFSSIDRLLPGTL
jgi:sortase A